MVQSGKELSRSSGMTIFPRNNEGELVKALGAFIRYCWFFRIMHRHSAGRFCHCLRRGGPHCSRVIEADGGYYPFCVRSVVFTIDAMTIGMLFLAKTAQPYAVPSSRTCSCQAIRTLGIFFLPLYLLSSATALVRGMDPYRTTGLNRGISRFTCRHDT